MNQTPVPRPDSGDAIAVIGGGVSGLTAARDLARAGAEVVLFDKGRRVAGRSSTREAEGRRRFDHGAQYFTAKAGRFEQQVSEWLADGVAAEWRGRLASFTCQEDSCREGPSPSPKTRYVGVPGMNAPALRLAEQAAEAGAVVAAGVRVASLKGAEKRWRLATDTGESLGDFARVLVTAPGPQAADLLTVSPALANAARTVRVTGCWAAMVAFDQRIEAEFDGAFVNGSADATPLSWVARDGSKPGRPDQDAVADCWVLHGSPEWSEGWIEADPAEALAELIAGFAKLLGGVSPRPAFAQAHRWRYALPQSPLADRFLADDQCGLYAAGDWCGGPRIEGAYLSGLAAAEAMLGR